MADHNRWTALLLATNVLFFSDCKPLDGYKFPVYTTESCPRNQTEWNERSSAINCTSKVYVCLPNEDLTELLEFCYYEVHLLIEKGLCMILRKRFSIVDAYSCRNFFEGCPNSNYRIYEIYKYRSCVSISNGCFVAEPTCIRRPTTDDFSNTEITASDEKTNSTNPNPISSKGSDEWVWIVTTLVVIGMIGIPIMIYFHKSKESSSQDVALINRMEKLEDENRLLKSDLNTLKAAALKKYQESENTLKALRRQIDFKHLMDIVRVAQIIVHHDDKQQRRTSALLQNVDEKLKLRKRILERRLKGKESELEEIENILQGTNVKELLKNYKENHPKEK